MISRNYFTFPFYLPRIYRLWHNWPEYLANYLLRRREPAEYWMRNGTRLRDGTGDLTGTLAVVFVRREYGHLDQFRTIVDIGANIGSFAVYAAECCPEARIFCFEPEQLNFWFLQRNISVNGLEGRVTAFQCAVASSGGQRDLAVGESLLNSFHIVAPGTSLRTVDCMTLRDILAGQNLETIDLLKMNCEGAEYEILEGCSSADLSRIDNIRLEYHNLDDHNRNGESLSRFLQTRGYDIERFTRYMSNSGFIWAARKARAVASLALMALCPEALAGWSVLDSGF